MRKFTQVDSHVCPLDRANVDTDLIIPKQFLKSIARTGFGPNLFDGLRYLDEGQPGMDVSSRPVNPDFVLNFPQYAGSEILLSRENFGCGSSREHAPWALEDYGFRVIIAPSFADIFYNNCFKNALLPVVLTAEQVDQLFDLAASGEPVQLTVSLENQTVSLGDGTQWSFEVNDFRKYCLINGLDDIGITLQDADAIRAFETKHQQQSPWLF